MVKVIRRNSVKVNKILIILRLLFVSIEGLYEN